ncbi:MAG TPA: aconitate hydratase, partial [Nitrososphaera sp.]|nr:aconitate hydratase [Nitrososphaera sp.]
ANLINFGIIPFEFQNASDFELLVQGTPITIENVVSSLKNENNKMIEAISDKNKITLKADLTPRQREVLIAGGLLNYTRSIQHRS